MVASLTAHSKDFAFYFGWQWEAIRGFWKREEILTYVLKIITLATLLTIWQETKREQISQEAMADCKKMAPNSSLFLYAHFLTKYLCCSSRKQSISTSPWIWAVFVTMNNSGRSEVVGILSLHLKRPYSSLSLSWLYQTMVLRSMGQLIGPGAAEISHPS